MEPDQSTEAMMPAETTAMLRRILNAVEKDKRKRWVEICCAVVLSLATVCSAWCAYESSRWSGVQSFRLAAANKAGRDSSAANLSAVQVKAFDASMFISYMQAKHDGNQKHEQFLFQRFRPEMKKAVEAWLKTDPFNNPEAPPSPFKMAEYSQHESDEAARQSELSAREQAAAQHANETSDAYVLLTVLFASVLFFGGIASSLDSRRVRIAVVLIALVFFVVTVSYLGTMPICRE
jgi:hypothetical protein